MLGKLKEQRMTQIPLPNEVSIFSSSQLPERSENKEFD